MRATATTAVGSIYGQAGTKEVVQMLTGLELPYLCSVLFTRQSRK